MLRQPLVLGIVALVLGAGFVVAAHAGAETFGGAGSGPAGRPGDRPGQATTGPIEIQSLDGTGNNLERPNQGAANTPYLRVGRANYADGRGAPVGGPNARFVSNRVFNDVHQNVFSETDVTQWGWIWGQFLDHTFGLRADAPASDRTAVRNIPFNAADPLENFNNTLGVIPFARSAAAPGTGGRNPRQQVNTISSYIDAFAVYGGTPERLEFLRAGPVDGDLSNNSALLLLPDGNLPTLDSRGNPAAAPGMEIDGRLRAQPNRAVVAGDRRANENIALQATQNLFAREHNRIVGLLNARGTRLTEEQKFQLARRVVIAEQQFITYNEFLPAFGVRLAPYRGYNPRVNPSLSNEFATVGYRAHSQIHGEFEFEVDADRYPEAQLARFEAQGIEVVRSADGTEVEIAVPLNVAFFNPDLLTQLQLGPALQGFGLEAQYRNDEMIDNQLRSVLFQIPVNGNPECLDGPGLSECFQGVVDLGAIDIERGRDHGMPTYNDMRRAYGLAPVRSFRELTGEATDVFPADPELTRGRESDDPDSLDFTALADIDGTPIDPDSDLAETSVVQTERRTSLAARLRAVYGSVDRVDAFVGMVAEPHLTGAELGALQMAIWARQFEALRDGDRFFFGNDPGLSFIGRTFGIDFRRTLTEIIVLNTDLTADQLNANVFEVAA
jgi:hypothetical protein